MKTLKKSLVFMLCLVALMGCSKKNETADEKNDTTKKQKMCPCEEQHPIAKDKLSEKLKITDALTRGDFLTIPISEDEAAEKIDKLLEMWPLEKLVRQMALGGYFRPEEFDLSNNKNATIILWYCYNPDNKDYPKMFLALEKVTKYDTTYIKKNTLSEPVANELIVPFTIFPYRDTVSSQTNEANKTLALIKKPVKSKLSIPSRKPISKKLAMEYIKKFKDMMATFKDLSGVSFNGYPYAAFGNDNHYKTFFKTRHDYVTYYFSLYYDSAHAPNLFRPILGLAEKNGKLIFGASSKTTVGKSMLQKSWPPPPSSLDPSHN